YEALKTKINNYDWKFIIDTPIDEVSKLFEDTFLNLVNECVPSKEVTVRTDDKPWYDSEIRKFTRLRDRLRKKATKSENPAHWQSYKATRNKVNNLKKHAKEKFYNNLEQTLTETASSNKRDFWKIIRHFVKGNKTSESIPPLTSTDVNNQTQMHFTDQEKVECLNTYFSSVSSITDEPPLLPDLMPKTRSKLESIVVTEEEVIDILESLNTNKASGPDLISNKMLKSVARSIAKPLMELFNRLLKYHKFPDVWKFSHVTSLYKKGDKCLPSNYRPVALLSNVGKAMERIVFKRVYNFLNENDLLYKYQSGFIPGHSTTFQLIDIYHHICQTFDQNQLSCMVFFDISKAFDRVWHPGLLHKLQQNGVTGELLLWFSDYLSDRTQSVVLNSVTSSKKQITAGVPQGSVLGPLLFLVYVNDISENLLSLTRLFADDSSLFVSASSLQDIEGLLNHDLILVSTWARQWLVNFNPNKTEAMLFSFRQFEDFPTLLFDGVDIKFVSNHKHLGLIFSDNMKWNVHIESILDRASRMIGVMRKLKYVFSRRSLNQTYISFIRPVLEYASIVWDGCTVAQRDSLEKLQNEIARIVTGLTKSVSLDRLYNECGWQPLYLRRKYQKLRFMYRTYYGMVPSYISDLMPPSVANVSQYNLRNSANLSTIPARTATFSKSCIPSAIFDWNNLPLAARESESYSIFCKELNRQTLRKVPNYYLDGKRKFSILHARLRNFCSNLNQDLYNNYLRDDPVCTCSRGNESAAHYFFECQLYEEQRFQLFTDTREFHPLNVHMLLKGKDSLSDIDNSKIFLAVQDYIQATGRFDS
ncbi:MAG: reverse transcriptase family protein, partial [Candidatus Thiodiazotropha sp.]